ncbi:hypothetical protein AB0L65_16695 [Nonomuraea sp. NPDC052116]
MASSTVAWRAITHVATAHVLTRPSWAAHLRLTVRFSDALRTLLTTG